MIMLSQADIDALIAKYGTRIRVAPVMVYRLTGLGWITVGRRALGDPAHLMEIHR